MASSLQALLVAALLACIVFLIIRISPPGGIVSNRVAKPCANCTESFEDFCRRHPERELLRPETLQAGSHDVDVRTTYVHSLWFSYVMGLDVEVASLLPECSTQYLRNGAITPAEAYLFLLNEIIEVSEERQLEIIQLVGEVSDKRKTACF